MPIFEMPRCCSSTFCAKIATVFATVAWAAIVLHNSNALDPLRYPVYGTMVEYVPEDVWAGIMLVLATVGAIGWFTPTLRRFVDPPIYGLMALFWMYLTASVYFWYPVLPPTGVPGVLTVCGLAIFAFISREHHRGPAA